MKEEIKESKLHKFNHNGSIFTILLIITMISFVPLTIFLNIYGLIISIILFIITFIYALKVERFKKQNNVKTYKEIIAFTEGKRLDEIEKNQEYGKLPYQQFLLMLGSTLITLLISLLLLWLLKPFL